MNYSITNLLSFKEEEAATSAGGQEEDRARPQDTVLLNSILETFQVLLPGRTAS